MDNEQELIKERLKRAPRDIQRALQDIAINNRLMSIAEKNGLRVDQTAILEDETVNVLLGFVHPDNYVRELQKELGLPAEKIQAIAQDVNEQIFKAIRTSLMAMAEEVPIESEETVEIPEQTTPSREDLLKEIEDESVLPPPIVTSARLETATPKPVVAPTPALEVKPPVPVAPVVPPPPPLSPLQQKLGGVVQAPKQNVVVNPLQPKQKIDPYRESVE